MREFYSDDATFSAGLSGFLSWFESEGGDLLGESATTDNTDTFTISDLEDSDIAHLPLDDDRDLSQAKGVVAVTEVQCSWRELEEYLARSDQDVIFEDNWDSYERSYRSSRSAFHDAADRGEFPAIEQDLTPFEDDFDPSLYEGALLLTENQVDPAAVLFVDIPNYPLYLDLRHGHFDIDGEDVEGMMLSSFSTKEAWDEGGNSGLLQNYSIEINLASSSDTTLRMLALWNEAVSAGVESDSPLVLSQTINKALASSERLSSICTGEIEIPDE